MAEVVFDKLTWPCQRRQKHLLLWYPQWFESIVNYSTTTYVNCEPACGQVLFLRRRSSHQLIVAAVCGALRAETSLPAKIFGQFYPASNCRMRSNFLKQSSADHCGSLSVFQKYERLAGFLCFNHSVHCRPICLLGKKLGQFFSVYQPYDKVRFPWKVVSWYSQQLGLSRQNFWSVGWLQISWDSWCLQAVALFQKQLWARKYS